MAATAELIRSLYAAHEAWRPVRKVNRADKATKGAIQFAAKIGRSKPSVKAAKAQAARIVRKAPQAMVKVSKATYGASHTLSNFTYISRNGKVPMYDQDGVEISEIEDMQALAQEWHDLNFHPDDLDTRHASPDARRLILSMPKNTDSEVVLRAARATARALFEDNFDYVYALHTDEGKGKSPNPHVHLTVRARGHDGKPLAFGPDDLLYMRRVFATELRERGVDADATPQIARGPKLNNEHSKTYQARLHVEKNNQDETKPKKVFERDVRRMMDGSEKEYYSKDVIDIYTDLMREMLKSDDPADRSLGMNFRDFASYNYKVNFDIGPSHTLTKEAPGKIDPDKTPQPKM